MHRRKFLVHCGLAAGTLLLPVTFPAVSSSRAADLAIQAGAQVTPGDRALLRLLSAYGSDTYFWGNGVLARATGIQTQGTVNLLVQVADYGRLVTFLRSGPIRQLGKIRVQDNTLSFTFQSTAYTVTNADPADFRRAVAGGGVTRSRVVDAGLGVFTHQTLMYHPATDTLNDPNLVLTSRKVDLVSAPTGGMKARVQTLVDGWMEAKKNGLKLGKKFNQFQAELLSSQPTEKAARKVVQALLKHLSELAGAFSVDDLRPLFTSPLVSASLQSALGLDAETVLADVEKLRAELSTGDYTDAALWLAALLGPQIQDGTVNEWLDLQTDDTTNNAASHAALSGAQRLLASPTFGPR